MKRERKLFILYCSLFFFDKEDSRLRHVVYLGMRLCLPFYELAELAPYSTHLPTQKQKVGRELGEKKKDSALEVAGEVEDKERSNHSLVAKMLLSSVHM